MEELGGPTANEVRMAVRAVCRSFGDAYWRDLDARRAYPTEFVAALTAAGWLAALIPEAYGGAGVGVTEAAWIPDEIHRSGGNAAACHAQMYLMSAVVRHGTDAQKARYLPGLARGELRLQAFGVTEPDAGSDTSRITTFARRQGDRFIVRGQKVFISRVEHSDLMLLLARTTPYEECSDKALGLSLFMVELAPAIAAGQIQVQPLDMMVNHHTTALFIDDLDIPAENVVGELGHGFRHVIDGWNAERILIAAECVGDGHWFVDRGVHYATSRHVFGRAIGANQGVQFPLASAHADICAAELMCDHAARLYDRGERCGAEANMAKLLASRASWAAANACLDAHGGYGFAVDYDVERKFRETRLYGTAPVANNLVLAYIGHHVLGMPRSY